MAAHYPMCIFLYVSFCIYCVIVKSNCSVKFLIYFQANLKAKFWEKNLFLAKCFYVFYASHVKVKTKLFTYSENKNL